MACIWQDHINEENQFGNHEDLVHVLTYQEHCWKVQSLVY